MGPVAGTGEPVATAELAAAVSNAGGLGVIGGVAYSPDVLRAEIRKLRTLTDKPFGVDLLLAPNFLAPQTRAQNAHAPRRDSLPSAHVEAIARIADALGIELKQAPPDSGQSGSWLSRRDRAGRLAGWSAARGGGARLPSGLGTPSPSPTRCTRTARRLSLVGTVRPRVR
jgi:hypothetical protein